MTSDLMTLPEILNIDVLHMRSPEKGAQRRRITVLRVRTYPGFWGKRRCDQLGANVSYRLRSFLRRSVTNAHAQSFGNLKDIDYEVNVLHIRCSASSVTYDLLQIFE